MKNSLLTPLVMALTLVFAGCSSTTQSGAVGASRSQLLLVSSEQLNAMAEQAYAKLKTDAAAKGALNTDAAMLARVRAVAARIQPAPTPALMTRPEAWESSNGIIGNAADSDRLIS